MLKKRAFIEMSDMNMYKEMIGEYNTEFKMGMTSVKPSWNE